MEANAPFFVDREVIVLTKQGIWLADGTEITHEPTRKLFAKSLKRDEAGYFLHIGKETKRIHVEDTAYFVSRMDGSPTNGILLWLSDESHETLDPKTLSYQPGRLTCKIKSHQEEAKFLHAAYFDLLKDLQEDSQTYYLEFGPKAQLTRVDLAGKR
jgi:hypothetical protein